MVVVPPAFTAECGLIGCEISVAPAPLRQMPLRERCPQPGGFGCGGDFAGPIQSPFTSWGLSEWGDRVLVSAFIIFLLLMHAIIIQEGERMTRIGTYGLKLDQQSYKPFMLYWNKIKGINILNVDIFNVFISI